MRVIRAPRIFLTVLLLSVLTLAAQAGEPTAVSAVADADVAPARQTATPGTLANFVGEKIRFSVTWAGIPVARATFSVTADEEGTFRMRVHSKTRSIVRWIYPVDATMTSIARNPGFSAVYYAKTGREGWGKNPQREVHFDHQTGQSSYIRNGELQRKLAIPANVLDPLSVLYYFRTIKDIDEKETELIVCDGKRIITGTVKAVGRETLTTPAGTFNTIIVKPVMEGIGGIFKKSPGATLLVWLTDDELHLPVKVQSDVAVGSFTALAEEIVAAAPPAPALK